MPQHSTTVQAASAAAYDAARHGAAILDRSDRGRIVVSGGDRASYLQGLLTNDIAALKPGLGCYAAYLTAQGRMIADMNVYELGDVLLVVTDRAAKDTVLAKFDQFIFTEDVQLGDVTDTFAQIAVIGPEAAAVLARAGIPAAIESQGSPHMEREGYSRASRVDWAGTPVIAVTITDAGEPGFDLFVDAGQREKLVAALSAAGAATLDAATADAIRIEAGVPLFHRDMDEETIPLEAGIESRAISFTKGCYVGQEVIIRVLHRGHGRIARKLVGLVFEGDRVPAPGASVRAGDREIGAVTSSTMSPALRRPIALAYVHRDFVEPGTSVSVDGAGTTVSALPFVAE